MFDIRFDFGFEFDVDYDVDVGFEVYVVWVLGFACDVDVFGLDVDTDCHFCFLI